MNNVQFTPVIKYGD